MFVAHKSIEHVWRVPRVVQVRLVWISYFTHARNKVMDIFVIVMHQCMVVSTDVSVYFVFQLNLLIKGKLSLMIELNSRELYGALNAILHV